MSALAAASWVFVVLLVLLLFFVKRRFFSALLVGFFMSLSWVVFYGYSYEGVPLFVFGRVNVFALVAWTVGLVVFSLVWEWFRGRYCFGWAFVFSGVFFLVFLNVLEWFAYHVLLIQLAPSYSGLPFFDTIHGPWFMKVYYLTAWIIFIFLYEWVKKKKLV